MARHRNLPGSLAMLLVSLAAPTVFAQEYSAGYASLRVEDDRRDRPIHLDVWYPAETPEQRHSYGLGVGSIAPEAPLATTHLPLVLLSHGAMGAASNYSWIAEPLARRGYVVLGISHYGESLVFGSESVDPAAASRFHDRIRDLEFALKFFLERSKYAPDLDSQRLALIGHSSGGAAALILAGAELSASRLSEYCDSEGARDDMGCRYPTDEDTDEPARVLASSLPNAGALVVLDPAVGPGFTDESLQAIDVPTLVVGSVDNDFLPYEAHAGRISMLIPQARSIELDGGEGHFVYLNECELAVEVMGVPLCADRETVDRAGAHQILIRQIEDFLAEHLGHED